MPRYDEKEMIKVFIGYDHAEEIAYHVLSSSIIRRSSVPVSITPIKLDQLPMTRGRDPHQSNEFSFSRFLVPYLCDYSGRAIFLDCDMLVLDDIVKLLDASDPTKAVSVVKHRYTPKDAVKYLGTRQYKYDKKNWSSVMVFNCDHSECKNLTPHYINTKTGLELHQFKWITDQRIGELSKEWNHLIGEYEPADAKLVHFTVGGPYFTEYNGCEYSDKWWDEFNYMAHCNQREVKAANE